MRSLGSKGFEGAPDVYAQFVDSTRGAEAIIMDGVRERNHQKIPGNVPEAHT